MADVVVLGQVGRDLVLRTSALPEAAARRRCASAGSCSAGRAPTRRWRWRSSACRSRWSVSSATTPPGGRSRRPRGRRDGRLRRHGAATALLLDLVEDGGVRRLIEGVPAAVLLTPEDAAWAASA